MPENRHSARRVHYRPPKPIPLERIPEPPKIPDTSQRQAIFVPVNPQPSPEKPIQEVPPRPTTPEFDLNTFGLPPTPDIKLGEDAESPITLQTALSKLPESPLPPPNILFASRKKQALIRKLFE